MKSQSHVIVFQARFAAAVESGAKRQTVRPVRLRRIRAGDRLSLREWGGLPYRSKQRVIREAVATSVANIWIGPPGVTRDRLWIDAEAAAVADGFCGWSDMLQWFNEAYGLPFHGIEITWDFV